MTDWDARMLELAKFVSAWSKDPSTKVGSVITDAEHRVLGVGYNGFPRGVKDHPERYEDRPTKYSLVVHAEANALLNCPAPGSLRGAILYATLFPCTSCTKLIIQSGIARVVAPLPTQPPWAEEAVTSRLMMDEAGVEWVG